MDGFSVIVPYYLNPGMLREQIRVWEDYPPEVSIILVDDGSPVDARSVVLKTASEALRQRLNLYRIAVDIPWNRGGARNLGAVEATSDWILHIDIDHVLPVECAERLLKFTPNPKYWYRFERYRNGPADETRQKDAIPKSAPYGKIHPHMDSYLCRRDTFWKAGGYDEDYSGCLGGGSPFLKNLAAVAVADRAPSDVYLVVYTRSVTPDASDRTLSRDRSQYAERKRRKERSGRTRGINPLRFPWAKQDLCNTRA